MSDWEITDDLVDALARALRELGFQKTSHSLTWDNAYDRTRYRYRRHVRAALEAAVAARGKVPS
jgi:hypothetical protein